MTDTGTAGGTAECEDRQVRAGACGLRRRGGRGMDASEDFAVFRRAAASEMDADDMAGGDFGIMADGDRRRRR